MDGWMAASMNGWMNDCVDRQIDARLQAYSEVEQFYDDTPGKRPAVLEFF